VEVTPDASDGSTIRELLSTGRFNRLVVTGPSPITHEHLFQRHAEKEGLNRFLLEVVNLHDQCARVHSGNPVEAARKARALVKMGVARARRLELLEEVKVGIVQSCLVVGGGSAGVSCACALASMGLDVHLVAGQGDPDGVASGDRFLVRPLLNELRSHERVRLHSPAAVGAVRGWVGGFTVDVFRHGAKECLRVGAIVVATAGDDLFQRDDFERSLALTKDGAGHYMTTEGILNPLDSVTAGVFICGPARADLKPADALLDGEAAASRAACVISSDVMTRPPVLSQVVDRNCDGCAYCVEPCPTRSITLLEYILGGETKKVIEVNDATCIGCGICMATCPKDGAFVSHYRPESFTDMIRAALEEDAESDSDLPVIIGFCCNRCAYPGADSAASAGIQYPPSIRIIRAVCLGMIHPNIVMDALARGADGVLLCGCYEGECRSREGIRRALARREGIRLLMEDFGLEEERFRLEHIAAAEGLKFARVVEEMTEMLAALGPSPYKRA
jgi:heterodisulfide reductase subunit A-like polyferredoxin/coenzyme F420-reducing hydrogenase delta subunit